MVSARALAQPSGLVFVQFAQAAFGPALEAAQLVVADVEGYAREPRAEGLGLPVRELAEREEGFGEALLNHFLNLLAAAEEAARDERDAASVTCEQLLEGRVRARAHLRDELRVGRPRRD